MAYDAYSRVFITHNYKIQVILYLTHYLSFQVLQ